VYRLTPSTVILFTLCLGYINQSVDDVHGKKIAVCSEIRTKYTHTLCGYKAEFLILKSDGIQSNH